MINLGMAERDSKGLNNAYISFTLCSKFLIIACKNYSDLILILLSLLISLIYQEVNYKRRIEEQLFDNECKLPKTH